MNIVQYIAENSPIQNVADLMNIHHGNPLGLSPLVQLLIIFVLVEVMDVFNNLIRYRDQQRHYPKVYVLLGLSLVAVFYYCFQSGMPILKEGAAMGQPSIGWFCRPGNVGWPLAILSWVLLSHVIYCLLNAVMQTTAQLTVESGFVDNKPWKEWKWELGILLFGASVVAITWFIDVVVAAWIMLIVLLVLALFAIGKVVADTMRNHKFGWAILTALVFFIGAVAAYMLILEVLRGCIFLIVFFVVYFARAKARKKQPKVK